MGINVEKITIYPFGGLTVFNMEINTKLNKELILLIGGPLFQILAYYILVLLFPNYHSIIINYHKGILLFNLLPIIPLDGGKLLLILLEYYIPFKTSIKIGIIISHIVIIILLLSINIKYINSIIMILFLVVLLYKFIINTKYIINKFYLERYLKTYHFKRKSIVNNIDNFYRNREHLIKAGDKYYLEKEYLNMEKIWKISKKY